MPAHLIKGDEVAQQEAEQYFCQRMISVWESCPKMRKGILKFSLSIMMNDISWLILQWVVYFC